MFISYFMINVAFKINKDIMDNLIIDIKDCIQKWTHIELVLYEFTCINKQETC